MTVDEIITMINIALGTVSIGDCTRGDANDDDQITVDEILTGVSNALTGCTATDMTPTPSPTEAAPTATPMPPSPTMPAATATPIAPTATVSVPTATPGDVTIRIGAASGQPGQTVTVDITLSAAGRGVVLVANEIVFPASAPITANGADPKCIRAAGSSLQVAAGFLRSPGCPDFESCQCQPGVTCTTANVIAESDHAITDGATLYTCSVDIAADAVVGAHLPLLCGSAQYVNDAEVPEQFIAECTAGEIIVAP